MSWWCICMSLVLANIMYVISHNPYLNIVLPFQVLNAGVKIIIIIILLLLLLLLHIYKDNFILAVNNNNLWNFDNKYSQLLLAKKLSWFWTSNIMGPLTTFLLLPFAKLRTRNFPPKYRIKKMLSMIRYALYKWNWLETKARSSGGFLPFFCILSSLTISLSFQHFKTHDFFRKFDPFLKII